MSQTTEELEVSEKEKGKETARRSTPEISQPRICGLCECCVHSGPVRKGPTNPQHRGEVSSVNKGLKTPSDKHCLANSHGGHLLGDTSTRSPESLGEMTKVAPFQLFGESDKDECSWPKIRPKINKLSEQR